MRDILLFLIDDWIVFFLACVFELSGDGTGGGHNKAIVPSVCVCVCGCVSV